MASQHFKELAMSSIGVNQYSFELQQKIYFLFSLQFKTLHSRIYLLTPIANMHNVPNLQQQRYVKSKALQHYELKRNF